MSLHEGFAAQRRRLEEIFEKHPGVRAKGHVASRLERRCFKIADDALQNIAIVERVEYNVFISGFEADIIVRLKSRAALNIEIDGPSHTYNLSKRRFCGLRDRVLEKEGIRVERWGYEFIDQMSQGELRSAFKALVQELSELQ